MKTKRWKLALALAVCAASLGAQAQGIRPSYTFPSGNRAGGVELGESGVFAAPLGLVVIRESGRGLNRGWDAVSGATGFGGAPGAGFSGAAGGASGSPAASASPFTSATTLGRWGASGGPFR